MTILFGVNIIFEDIIITPLGKRHTTQKVNLINSLKFLLAKFIKCTVNHLSWFIDGSGRNFKNENDIKKVSSVRFIFK